MTAPRGRQSGPPAPPTVESARRALAAALADLRAAVDAASGEWWRRVLPGERVVRVERAGHRTLAATVRQSGLCRSGEMEGVLP